MRVSHPIKGRIPSAVGKPAKELEEHEKTLYFERIAIAMEIPSINGRIADNGLNLTVGGVRAYNLTNLHSRKTEEHFKLLVGFQNKVCTNLCISTDGFLSDVKVRTVAELAKAAYNLFGEYNAHKEIDVLNNLPGTMITEQQFAQIVGRARLYQNMPYKQRKNIPAFPLMDSQVNLVVLHSGKLKRLYCPFWGICKVDVPPLQKGNEYAVDAVKMTLKLEEVFIIEGRAYFFWYFEIKA